MERLRIIGVLCGQQAIEPHTAHAEEEEAAAAAWAESAPSRSLSSEGLLASDAEAGVASRSSGSGGGSGDDGEAEEPVGPPAFPAFAGTPWANKPRVA